MLFLSPFSLLISRTRILHPLFLVSECCDHFMHICDVVFRCFPSIHHLSVHVKYHPPSWFPGLLCLSLRESDTVCVTHTESWLPATCVETWRGDMHSLCSTETGLFWLILLVTCHDISLEELEILYSIMILNDMISALMALSLKTSHKLKWWQT